MLSLLESIIIINYRIIINMQIFNYIFQKLVPKMKR